MAGGPWTGKLVSCCYVLFLMFKTRVSTLAKGVFVVENV